MDDGLPSLSDRYVHRYNSVTIQSYTISQRPSIVNEIAEAYPIQTYGPAGSVFSLTS